MTPWSQKLALIEPRSERVKIRRNGRTSYRESDSTDTVQTQYQIHFWLISVLVFHLVPLLPLLPERRKSIIILSCVELYFLRLIIYRVFILERFNWCKRRLGSIRLIIAWFIRMHLLHDTCLLGLPDFEARRRQILELMCI